jgi:hypothetical protein
VSEEDNDARFCSPAFRDRQDSEQVWIVERGEAILLL